MIIFRFLKYTGQALICLSFFSMFFTSCKWSRTSEIIGPEACPSEQFAVLQDLSIIDHNPGAATHTLNLLSSYADIKAEFSESISYTLTITGETSGAVFKVEGKGKTINLNWYGNSSNGKYFESGEVLSGRLTNVYKTEPITNAQVTLITKISYSGFGVKVINFEDVPVVNTSPATGHPLPSELKTPSSLIYEPSPQGENYFHFETTTAMPAWFFDYMTFNGINYSSLGTDPSKVYLNFFAKGKVNSQVQMIINETAHGATLTRKFYASVSPDGWNLFSVRLSDIGILNPSQIKTLSVNFAAAAYQDTSCMIDLDLVIFTLDKPF